MKNTIDYSNDDAVEIKVTEISMAKLNNKSKSTVMKEDNVIKDK